MIPRFQKHDWKKTSFNMIRFIHLKPKRDFEFIA